MATLNNKFEKFLSLTKVHQYKATKVGSQRRTRLWHPVTIFFFMLAMLNAIFIQGIIKTIYIYTKEMLSEIYYRVANEVYEIYMSTIESSRFSWYYIDGVRSEPLAKRICKLDDENEWEKRQ